MQPIERKERKHNMNKHHFSLGNSTSGVLGLCAEIVAETREEATSKLRSALAGSLDPFGTIPIHCDDSSVGYINIYLSPENIAEWQDQY